MTSAASSFQRYLLYFGLAACFGLAFYFKQWDIFYAEPFAAIAFCGAIGICIDYALKIRKESLLWLIPVLLACELSANMISKAGIPYLPQILYVPGALLFLTYGVLFVRSAWQNRSIPGISLKFSVLGFLSAGITAWEAITYFPDTFDKSHLGWRILYLSVFAWLLLIDFSTKWEDKPQLRFEKDLLRQSLLVIAMMYFERFIFQ